MRVSGGEEQQEPGARVPAEGEGVAGGQEVTVSSAGTSYRRGCRQGISG